VSLLEAQRRAGTERSALGFLIGAAVPKNPLDAALEVPDEVRSHDELYALAEQNRQQLIASAIAVDVAADEVRVQRGRWYPSLVLDLDVFLARDSAPTDQDWRGLIDVNLPLFTGGRIQADVRDALSNLREAKLAYSLMKRSVLRDIEVAVFNLDESRDRVAELRVQLASAQEASQQAEGL
jgi:outer membrane protein TolC